MMRIYETLQEEVNQIWSSEQKSNYYFLILWAIEI